MLHVVVCCNSIENNEAEWTINAEEEKKKEKQGIIIQIPGSRWSIGASFIFTYPLTVGVVTSQPVSSIFLYSPLPSGTWRTLGLCPFPNVVFPLLFKRGKKTRQTKKKRGGRKSELTPDSKEGVFDYIFEPRERTAWFLRPQYRIVGSTKRGLATG